MLLMKIPLDEVVGYRTFKGKCFTLENVFQMIEKTTKKYEYALCINKGVENTVLRYVSSD
jgi:hypothetical protein